MPKPPNASLTKWVTLPDGQTLYVRDEGNGPAVVFIHGLPGIAKDFSPLISKLCDRFRCISYDRAGYGASAPADKKRPVGIRKNVEDLTRLLDTLDVQRVVLVGWSYGGHIALAAAGYMPTRVTRVVLLGSAGPRFRFPPTWTDVLLYHTPIGKLILRILVRLGPTAFRGPLNAAYGSPAPHTVVEDFWKAISRPGALSHWFREASCWNPRDPSIEDVQQPCLILHGDADTRVPLSVARDLAGTLEHSTLVEIPGAGHWPFATHTHLVEDHMRQFLNVTET